jgi:hypothetical protein
LAGSGQEILSREEAMKGRYVSGLMLSAMLLLLAGGSGQATGPQPMGPWEAAGASASSSAKAPWVTTEVDTLGDTGQHTSVAIDEETGRIYVSYYDATEKDLRVARYVRGNGNCGPGDTWLCQTVDDGDEVGQYSSIAIWEDTVMVAYYDATNRSLKLATSTDPLHWVWDKVTLDVGLGGIPSTGLYTSAQFSETGQEFLAYYFDNPTDVDALKVAYRTYANGNCPHPDPNVAEAWRCDTIMLGDGVGQHASMVVTGGAQFEVFIAYYKASTGELWYATSLSDGNCGFWDGDMACYPVTGASADVGRYASLYVDSSNHFHIAYYDATNKKLKYAYQVDDAGGNCGILGSARCVEIDSMPADYHPLGISIAEDANGYPVIAYQSADGSLNVARPLAALGMPAGSGNCGPQDPFLTWHCATIDRSGIWINYRNADFASITLSSSGLATIAYNGFITSEEGGNLMVARQRYHVALPVVVNNK